MNTNQTFTSPLYLLQSEQSMNWNFYQDMIPQQQEEFYTQEPIKTDMLFDYTFDLPLDLYDPLFIEPFTLDSYPPFSPTASVSSQEEVLPEKKRGRKRKMPVDKRKHKRYDNSKTTHSTTRCTNCKTNNTPLWRRNPQGQPLCNACGLFLKLHGTVRPLSLKTDVIKKRNRSGTRRTLKQQDTESTTSEEIHDTYLLDHSLFNQNEFYL